MTCPCCGSDDTSGPTRHAVLCWECYARFKKTAGGVLMVDCMCSRHDDGKIIKEVKTAEETLLAKLKAKGLSDEELNDVSKALKPIALVMDNTQKKFNSWIDKNLKTKSRG